MRTLEEQRIDSEGPAGVGPLIGTGASIARSGSRALRTGNVAGTPPDQRVQLPPIVESVVADDSPGGDLLPDMGRGEGELGLDLGDEEGSLPLDADVVVAVQFVGHLRDVSDHRRVGRATSTACDRLHAHRRVLGCYRPGFGPSTRDPGSRGCRSPPRRTRVRPLRR